MAMITPTCVPLMDALLSDMSDTTRRQEQCGRALRALSALAAPPSSSLSCAPSPVMREDLAALLGIVAEQSMLLAAEAADTIRGARSATR